MPALRGVTVSVGRWYAELLAITLPRNMRHLTECLVVTAPGDPSIEVARDVPGVRVFETDAFYRHEAKFNKSYSLELSFDVLGRHGWIVIWDADCLWADSLPLDRMRPGFLHGARRRILDDPTRWTPELDWRTLPLNHDGSSPIGFFQAFAADDLAIKDKRPWYDVTFAHAGGGDAYFLTHWAPTRRVMLPLEVLHLGRVDQNWFGADQEGRDMMARFVTENQWRRAMRMHPPEAAARAAEPVHRVEVPGYEPTGYELPFVRRARQAASRPR